VIAENIVDQFNGKIFFDSVPKKGSTFTFTFELLSENDFNNLELNIKDSGVLNS
jgi:signal transduction histidine kinase